MSVTLASINSGSNGNCYYIGNKEEAVLIDAGISCREIEKRIKKLGLSLASIKAVVISHEHNDHILGLETLAKKYSLPVFITSKTLKNIRGKSAFIAHSFSHEQPIKVGNILITPFLKQHDAADPHSFVVRCNNLNVGVFTDIGYSCSSLIKYFGQCHVAFLEANYDEKMLLDGRYPHHLKQRIHGNNGHLSNNQALELFLHHRSEKLTHLILSHLSQENNSPDIVEQLFNKHPTPTQILIASRTEASAFLHFPDSNSQYQKKVVQAKLFE